MFVSMVVTVEGHHRSEKRLRRIWNKNQFSCMMYKATSADRREEKPHLLFELEMRYCIKCNNKHWFIGDEIEFDEVPGFNPNDHTTLALEEMGYFAQFDDASGK